MMQEIFIQITAQPFWVSMLVLGSLFFAVDTILRSKSVGLLHRFLVYIPLLLFIAVAYFQHGPFIATVALSAGFLLSFVLAFAQLAGK